jgi:proline iminopeptidase
MQVSAAGADIHYTTRGQGPTCLFPCSFGTRPTEAQTEGLSRYLRVVHVDLRGSGQSTGQVADLTFDLLAQDLEAVRKDLGADRVAVLGHSILGSLAFEYGRRCPQTVSHVIAVGTPPTGDMAAVSARGQAFFEQDASEERKRVLRENLAALPPGTPPAMAIFAHTPMRFHDPRFDARPLFAEAIFKPEVLMHLMGPLTAGWDVTSDLASLKVPTFLALGRHDYVVPHVLWEGVAARVPNLTTKVFERSGHQAFFEEPDAFGSAVVEWMKRTG